MHLFESYSRRRSLLGARRSRAARICSGLAAGFCGGLAADVFFRVARVKGEGEGESAQR